MTNIKPGIYPDTTFEEYIEWNAFHKSMVGPALRSTAHLHHYIESEKKATKLMDFGSLVDCLILEPKIFEKDFRMIPETYINSKDKEMPWTLKSNFCRDWMEDVRSAGETPYKSEDRDKALLIMRSCNNHKTASEWLDGAQKQVAIVWEDPETEILCKGRIDMLAEKGIYDLKTTSNASPFEFRRVFNNLLYHVQASMYSEGLATLNEGNLLPFGLIVAEADAPFCVATYIVGPESLVTGDNLFKRAIRKYKDYLELGPTGYSNFAEEINIPNWALLLEGETADV